jgi:2-polyprenyl-6-methoxyphenol hydroxylase-like FAD-dependent oxidoreductase
MSLGTTLNPHCDVLVVGAGPTGLMAANLLRRRGIDVQIVDARAEPSRESRAFAVVARSMELFGQLGLAERLLDRGVVNPGIDFYVGGDHVGGLNYDKAASPDTPYCFITLHPQADTEAILIEDLSRLGIAVQRQNKVTGLAQDAEGVTVQVTTAEGTETRIRCAYVIGADGAHSVVRHALGLAFEGAKYAQTFLLADCRVTWPEASDLDHARFRVFMRGSTIALFLPLDGANRSRVMATDPTDKADLGGTEAAALDLAELEAVYAQATGLAVKLSDPVWTTRYRVHHRGVSSYGNGRVFVAGDAAHIHSPAGGQGMNTGLQDAANLAWKLAAALKGAPPDLLDTYDAERLPVGRQVVQLSDRMFSAAAGRTGWEATLRDWVARPVSAAISRMASVQHQAFRKLSQLEIAYPAGRFVEDAAPSLGEFGPQVGHRAPNAAIARHRDVFDLTVGYGFTVLALSRKPLEREQAHRLADALDALASGFVTPHLVTRLAVGRDPRLAFVSDSEVFDTYGLRDRDAQAIYLIRPDGYVAWRCEGLDIAACRRFLSRFGMGE